MINRIILADKFNRQPAVHISHRSVIYLCFYRRAHKNMLWVYKASRRTVPVSRSKQYQVFHRLGVQVGGHGLALILVGYRSGAQAVADKKVKAEVYFAEMLAGELHARFMN